MVCLLFLLQIHSTRRIIVCPKCCINRNYSRQCTFSNIITGLAVCYIHIRNKRRRVILICNDSKSFRIFKAVQLKLIDTPANFLDLNFSCYHQTANFQSYNFSSVYIFPFISSDQLMKVSLFTNKTNVKPDTIYCTLGFLCWRVRKFGIWSFPYKKW